MKINISEEESMILTRRFVDKYRDLTINYLRFLKEINNRISTQSEKGLKDKDINRPSLDPKGSEES
jgi:hypothetical protein